MLIEVKRHWFNQGPDEATLSVIKIDGQYFCYGLEDKYRPSSEPKVDGKTAIPCGEYTLVIDYSNRFQRPMPHILSVPRFTGVRIHAGNTTANTEGCLLIGFSRAYDKIAESKRAFDTFFPRLEWALKSQVVCITFENEPL